jgi:uncharacterized membrane protein
MKRFTPLSLLGVLVVAGATGACSDGTAPRHSDAPASVSLDRSSDRAEPGAFTTIDMPGATTTLAMAINDAGVISGRYLRAGRTHGFVRTTAGELTTIDVPGSGFTAAAAINNRGDVVGWYQLLASPAIRHGFLLRDGEFTTIDPPGSIWTNVVGINDRGDITGRFCIRTPCGSPGSGDFHAFRLSDGEFTTIDVPGSIESNAWKSNDRGQIVGGYGHAGAESELFLLQHGEFTTIALPHGKYLWQDNGGINARGDVVSKYCDASPCSLGPAGHGFMLSDGNLTTIDVPDAVGTAAFAINARRDVVGGYFDAAGTLHGYLTRIESKDESH